MKNIIIITGASSGMGKEFVKQVDSRFPKVDEIWLIARRKDVLQELADSCHHTCRVLALDLCAEDSIKALRELLKQEKPNIRLLVNSAGYGILGSFYQGGIDVSGSGTEGKEDAVEVDKEVDFANLQEQIGMIDLNCRVLTAVTYSCIPYMERGGRIIQLASSAAFLPQPKFAVYAASKSYVLSFSRALNQELRPKTIHVTAVCPGPVKTEFFDRAEKGQDSLLLKKLVMAKPEKVVEKALHDTRNKKEVSVYGILIQAFLLWAKIVPHKWILGILRYLK